jgi:hypothetical protein
MSSAFYVSDGGLFVSSGHTRGPWDPDSQHAGPPAALIGRELERCPSPTGQGDWQLALVTYALSLRTVYYVLAAVMAVSFVVAALTLPGGRRSAGDAPPEAG